MPAMDPGYRRVQLGGFGSGRPVPTDIWVLLGVVFVTFSLQFFETFATLIALLRLTPLVWQFGFVWQLGTYPFIGYGPPSIWILLELLILFWFSRDVFYRLGRKSFWKLLAWSVIGAGLAAVAVELIVRLAGGGAHPQAFLILQGQRMLIAVTIAAFAVLYRQATILLFFVLPVQARWFLWLEILFAFIAFLGTKDFAGFVGVCTAVGITYSLLTRGGLLRNLRRGGRETWKRLHMAWIRWRLDRMRRQRDFRVIEGEGKRRRGNGAEDGEGDGVSRGPWVH